MKKEKAIIHRSILIVLIIISAISFSKYVQAQADDFAIENVTPQVVKAGSELEFEVIGTGFEENISISVYPDEGSGGDLISLFPESTSIDTSIAVNKDIAYISRNNWYSELGYLDVFDISNPKSPRRLKEIEIQPWNFASITLKENMAYLMGGKYDSSEITLQVFDISKPEGPITKGFLKIPFDDSFNLVPQAAVRGNTACIPTGEYLQIINVADPDNPQIVGNYKAECVDVELTGDMAFVAARSEGMLVIDLSNPSVPELKGQYVTEDSYCTSIGITEKTAYLFDAKEGLIVLDISNPETPMKLGEFKPIKAPGEATLSVQDDTVFILGEKVQMQLIDVSNPQKPKSLGNYALRGSAFGYYLTPPVLGLQGETAYVTHPSKGFMIIDLSKLKESESKFSLNFDSYEDVFGGNQEVYLEDIAVQGNTAYLSDVNYIYVLDISDHKKINLISSLYKDKIGRCKIDFQKDKNILYLTYNNNNWYSSTNNKEAGLMVIDVSDIYNPEKIGSLDLKVNTEYQRFFVSDDLVYIASADGLQIIDATDPYNPIIIGSLPLEANTFGQDITVKDNLAYMSVSMNPDPKNSVMRDWELWIIDVSDPKNPMLMGRCSTEMEIIALLGETVYGAEQHFTTGNKFQIFDVSNPKNPARIKEVSTKEAVSEIVFHNDNAYVCDQSGAVLVYDVSDPENPLLKDSYNYAGWLDEGIAVQENYIYLALYNGLYITPPSIETEASFSDQNHIRLSLPQALEAGNYNVTAFSRNLIAEKPGAITIIDQAAVNKAVIVAGGDPGSGENKIRKETDEAAKRAYEALRYQGYSDEDIFYLGPNPDGDTQIDKAVTKENIKAAVTQWAADATDLIVFIVGHGGKKIFKVGQNEEITSAELDGWLDQLQTDAPELERVTLIYDSCQSGSFSNLQPPAGKERIVIASTEADQPAYFLGNGALSFSYQLWNEVYNGAALGEAFGLAKERMSQFQTARMDADADGVVNEAEDIANAAKINILRGYAQDTFKPYIFYAEVPEAEKNNDQFILKGEISATIKVRSMHDRNGEPMDKVWALIKPPGFTAGSPDVPVTDLPVVELAYIEDAYYQGKYENFSGQGEYTVTILARNKSGLTGLPLETVIVQEINVKITAVSELQALNGAGTATIWAEIPAVQQGLAISRVEAEITFPDQTSKETITLSDPDGNGRFEANYNGFSENGLYEISISAFTSEGSKLESVKTAFIQPESTPGEPDAYEPDNSREEAKIIDVNGKEAQNHAFHNASDTDWAKVYGIENEGYKIRVDKLGALFNPAISIYDASGQLVKGPVNDSGPGETEETYWICEQTGIHYIRVRNTTPAIFGEKATYELEVYRPIGQLLGYLAGRLLDASGSPIPNARIRTDANATALSRATGYFVIIQKPGDFSVTIEADGYSASTRNITIKEGETTDLENLTLASAASADTSPVATITHPTSDLTVNAGDTVYFSGSVSKGDSPFTYTWSFGGAADNAASLSPGDVTFDNPGEYTVIFTVTDKDNDTHSATVTITVVATGADMAVSIISPETDITVAKGGTLTFKGNATGGNKPFSWFWNFNGGAADASVQNPGEVTFQTPGKFEIILTVTGSSGETVSNTKTVTVNGGLTNSPPGGSAGGAGCFIAALDSTSTLYSYLLLIFLFMAVYNFFWKNDAL